MIPIKRHPFRSDEIKAIGHCPNVVDGKASTRIANSARGGRSRMARSVVARQQRRLHSCTSALRVGRGDIPRARQQLSAGSLGTHGHQCVAAADTRFFGFACLREERHMKAMKNMLVKLVKDEQGGEVLEYALIAGLIVVAAVAVIGSVGGKVLAKWNGVNTGLDTTASESE
jgi:Flp pilus assembly pilin Flp